jgi:hypothetical protein
MHRLWKLIWILVAVVVLSSLFSSYRRPSRWEFFEDPKPPTESCKTNPKPNDKLVLGNIIKGDWADKCKNCRLSAEGGNLKITCDKCKNSEGKCVDGKKELTIPLSANASDFKSKP